MPLFGRSKRGAAAPAINFDPYYGHPQARWIAERCQAGDWRAVHELCESESDWHARHRLADVIGDLPQFPSGWVEQTGGASFPLLARGVFRIREAWRVRGNGRAEGVSATAWRPFGDWLRDAQRDLLTAAERRPADPNPWAYLLLVSMGLSLGTDVALEWYGEATARDADFQPAHMRIIDPVAKKWGGSHELMFEVARRADATLPEGSPGRVAIVRAHAERHLYHLAFDNDEAAAQNYYRDPAVGAEIGAAAQRSVLSPLLPVNAETPALRSQFTLALALAGDGDRRYRLMAAYLFDALGDSVPDYPWTSRWPQTGGQQYLRIRTLCQREREAGPA